MKSQRQKVALANKVLKLSYHSLNQPERKPKDQLHVEFFCFKKFEATPNRVDNTNYDSENLKNAVE